MNDKVGFDTEDVRKHLLKNDSRKYKDKLTKEERKLLEYCHNMMSPERIKNKTDLMSMLNKELKMSPERIKNKTDLMSMLSKELKNNPIEFQSDVDQETPNIIIKGKDLDL